MKNSNTPLANNSKTPIIAFTAAASCVVTSLFFILKRKNEIQDQKRSSAKKFLAKINECLFDAKEAGNKGEQCVCHESYAEFRLTLDGKEATELEKCWNEYLKAKQQNVRCIISLECLHRLVHEYTKTFASELIDDCSVCSG